MAVMVLAVIVVLKGRLQGRGEGIDYPGEGYRATQGIKLLPRAFRRPVFDYRESPVTKKKQPERFYARTASNAPASAHKTWAC